MEWEQVTLWKQTKHEDRHLKKAEEYNGQNVVNTHNKDSGLNINACNNLNLVNKNSI